MAEGDISNSTVKRKNCDEDDGHAITKKIRSNDSVFQGFKLTKILNESSQKKLIYIFQYLLVFTVVRHTIKINVALVARVVY